MTQTQNCILTISCPDRSGLVAAIAQFLSDNGAFILESAQFGDQDTNRFFMRVAFHFDAERHSIDSLSATFQTQVASRYQMDFNYIDPAYKPRVLILVSKFGHCLNDLLFRAHTGGLNIEVPAVISNHALHQELAQWHKIPFHHIPVHKENKLEAEAQIHALIESTQADLVVLARYMQVLSHDFSTRYAGKIINIHHSFLPSFKGAEPYSQAHSRGVKIIGATAHYVTADLDEGPIIEQRVERVDHNRSVPDLVALGRDLEAITLARAVQAHIQHRIFLNGRKTVVFS